MANSEKIVSIFGSGKVNEESESFKLAEEVGYAIAEHGYTIANGGYNGTMLASAKGAARANGNIIGVICSALTKSRANAYVTEEVFSHSLDQRVKLLIDMADAYVVLPGATGTLLELASIWELKNKGFLPKDKPIIIVGRFWQPLIDLIGSLDPGCSDYIDSAENPKQVLEILEQALQRT